MPESSNIYYNEMSKVFSLSEAGSIAIHGMVLIAKAEDQMNVVKISERTGSSKHHVAKVFQRLVKDDFLISHRGPSGGFRLKKPASEISLLDIYESIEGKIEVSECPVSNPICPFSKCIIGGIITDMTQNFKTYLQSQTLDKYIED